MSPANPIKVKVLYVEDEDATRLYITRILDSSLVDAHMAANEQEAIKKLTEEDYDLVVLDWWLVDPDTLKVTTSEGILEWMKAHKYRALPLVFTSDKTGLDESRTGGIPVLRKEHKDVLHSQVQKAAEAKLEASRALKGIRDIMQRMTSNVNVD